MGLVLATEGKLHQTKMCTCYPWCVKVNGAGGVVPTMGSGQTRARLAPAPSSM